MSLASLPVFSAALALFDAAGACVATLNATLTVHYANAAEVDAARESLALASAELDTLAAMARAAAAAANAGCEGD